ncbi:hypothetical protein GCM10009020_13260 [Natronoarchaeum mannanilyticum]|uniref:Transposase n=1 Tax=Natronoarchaeum mannanilyticum TaxID=926360 RepID=A0AAV3T840_9EURY
MKRVNTFDVVPQTENDKECLLRLLDASASLWNELTYERRQNYFGDSDVWDTSEYRGRYNGVVGSATIQQVTRKNSEAWRSFFALKEKGKDPNPPSYWGNEEDGRELRTYIRNNQYTIQWGKRSRLEIPVGQELKDEYGLGYYERLRLEVRGNPKWDGKQGRLELEYDEMSDTFRVSNQSPSMILDWIHHWLRTKPPSTLAQTISLPVPRLLVPSTSTTDRSCSNGSVRRPTKSPAYSRNSERDATVPSGFDGCTDSERNAVTTHRTRWYATSLNGCTTREWRRCTWAT